MSSWTHVIRTIYNIKEVVDTNTPVKELDKDLSVSGHIAFYENKIHEADKQHVIITKPKRYAKLIIKGIRERFPEDNISILNALNIFNVELLPRNAYSQGFHFY